MIASNLGRHENAFVQIGQNASVSKSPRPYRSDRCQEVKLTSRMTVLGRVAAPCPFSPTHYEGYSGHDKAAPLQRRGSSPQCSLLFWVTSLKRLLSAAPLMILEKSRSSRLQKSLPRDENIQIIRFNSPGNAIADPP